MNRLTKRFIFCNAAGNGDTNKGKAETNMRRMLAMALAILMMTALLSGAQARQAEETALSEQVGTNRRLLSQLVELDKRVNKKVTGEKSIYQ